MGQGKAWYYANKISTINYVIAVLSKEVSLICHNNYKYLNITGHKKVQLHMASYNGRSYC